VSLQCKLCKSGPSIQTLCFFKNLFFKETEFLLILHVVANLEPAGHVHVLQYRGHHPTHLEGRAGIWIKGPLQKDFFRINIRFISKELGFSEVHIHEYLPLKYEMKLSSGFLTFLKV
jgi:hypothetical protein